jgi:hypothetical protein
MRGRTKSRSAIAPQRNSGVVVRMCLVGALVLVNLDRERERERGREGERDKTEAGHRSA